MPEQIPDIPDEDVSFTMPTGDAVRLATMLLYVEETHEERIVRGWAGKMLSSIQDETQLNLDDVAAYQDDIDRIADGELGDDEDVAVSANGP